MPAAPRDYSQANRIAATPRGALTGAGGGRPRASGAEIMHETICKGCGYNLIGLRVGQPCPECGRPIGDSRAWTWDTLCDAPVWYVRTLGFGFAMMGLAPLAMVAASASASVAASSPAVGGPGVPPPWWVVPLPIAALLASAMWLGGLLIVCRARPMPEGTPRPRAEWVGMRLTCVLSQGALVAGGALWLLWSKLQRVPPAPSSIITDLVGIVALLAAVIGFIGWAPTAALLSRYADWASDTRLADGLRNATWGMVAGAFVLAAGYVLPASMGGVLFDAFAWLIGCLVVGAVAYFLWAVFGLAILCARASKHITLRTERDVRMVKRMRTEAAAEHARFKSAPEIEPPDLHHRVGTPRR